MPMARYHRFKGWAMLGLAAFFSGMAVFTDTDRLGTIFLFALAAFVAAAGGFHLWRAARVHPQSVAYGSLDAAPPELQLVHLRRMLPLGTLAFLGLSTWTAFDLHQLESGAVQSVQVTWPVGPIYAAWGFWPAVLALPSVGVACLGLLWRRWRRLVAARPDAR
jgi:hypothetical protein